MDDFWKHAYYVMALALHLTQDEQNKNCFVEFFFLKLQPWQTKQFHLFRNNRLVIKHDNYKKLTLKNQKLQIMCVPLHFKAFWIISNFSASWSSHVLGEVLYESLENMVCDTQW
jgi:hypothetical protein